MKVNQTVGGLNADLADKKMFAKGHRYLVVTREFPLPIVSDIILAFYVMNRL